MLSTTNQVRLQEPREKENKTGEGKDCVNKKCIAVLNEARECDLVIICTGNQDRAASKCDLNKVTDQWVIESANRALSFKGELCKVQK